MNNKDNSVTANTRKDQIEGLYPLSGLQQGMLFHSLYDGKVGAYMQLFECDVIGINLEVFTKSWEYTLKRHSILRSAFYYDKFNVPVQCVFKEVQLPVEVLDYSQMGEEEQSRAIKIFKVSEQNKGFNFKAAPLMRLTLIHMKAGTYRMFWAYHHIIMDGWSMPILMEEFLNAYESFSKGDTPVLKEIDRYEDYIRFIERRDKKQEQLYWENYLGKIDTGTLIPFMNKTEERTKGIGSYGSLSMEIGAEISAQIRDYVQKHRLTINTLMQGVWAYILHEYVQSNDIVYGVVVSGRPEDLPGVEHRVGMYINTLPLHTHINEKEKIDDWLRQLQKDQVSAREYQHTPLSVIKEWTKIPGDLFDSLLVFENYPVSKVIGTREWSLQVKNVTINEHNNYPLSIVVGSSDQIQLKFSYNTLLLQKSYVEKISRHFENVLKQIVQDNAIKISDLILLTSLEEHELLVEFNNRETPYPKNKSIKDVFEEQVDKTPGNIALSFEGEMLTYYELNERSNQLASFIKQKNIKEGSMIPISIERGSFMMIGILGILKAGCAYVPIDPGYPEDRIKFMLEDVSADVILSSRASVKRLPGLKGVEIIEVDTEWETIRLQPAENIALNILPENLAYVIYTSGSTGKPKGVLVTQKNVVSLVKETDYVSFGGQNILLSTGSSSFDATTFEYWGMLLNGGQLVLCPETKLLDSELLKNEIETRKVNIMWFTSSWLNQLVETDITIFEKLKTILAGGEKLSQSHIERLKKTYPLLEIINGYGPTENTTFSLTYNIKDISENTSIPIGRPLNNRTAFVLNEKKKLVPVAVAGEIYLGGSGVAKGYLNQDDLTAERFISNPFSKEPGEKLYKTGDQGRWLPDGNIEYLGRIDSQVKIRGYRIELEEIEAVLLQCDLVKQAIVVAKEDNLEDKRLVAYIVPQITFEKEKIISYLNSKLPEYMVPALFIEIDHIPLTANGKVDKRALPDPEVESNQQDANPRNETEEKLAKVWMDVLKVDEIGIHDDFFEMGGHSLLAIRLMSVLRKELGLEINIGDIFEYPTIATLAGHLANKASDSVPPIKAGQRPENIPLSFSQERLWFIDQLEGSLQYHIPTLLRLTGDLNTDALARSLQTIINRHEVLRTVFVKKDNNAYQSIKEKDLWELNLVDNSDFKEDADKLKNYIQELIRVPFDLSKDHMLRATIIKLNDREHLLSVTIHHIASDGWSLPVIVKELASLYNSYDKNLPVTLPALEIQYADYAIWQRNYLQGEVLDKKINYWKNKLEGVTALDLPTDYPRPAFYSTRGESKGFNISKELTDKLNLLSRDEGATLFMVLLAAFKIMLQRYSSQEDICIGIPIANRAQQEVDLLIGFFVNTLALRSNINPEGSFKEFLQKVRATTMEAYEHQDVPFEKVVEAVVKERDLSRSPLFQIMFVLQNTPDVPQLELGDISLSPESYQHTTAKFDLSVSINEHPNGLRVSINYSTDLYKSETIDQMFSHFRELLISIVNSPQLKISQLRMLTESEEEQLLVNFNDTSVDYPRNKSIIDLFEEQVKLSPESIALIYDEKAVSYQQLNKRANKLARYLIDTGVKEEMLVPVCIERGIEMIVGILGILKAGGAYVPVDTEYPEDRIRYMLEDTGATLVLTSKQTRQRLPSTSLLNIIELDTEWEKINEEDEADLTTKIGSGQLAYVIYTSGSTGKPKGVMIEHAGVVNLALSQAEALRLKPVMRTMQFASFGFDASCYEIFNTFLSGGTLVLPKKEDLLSLEKFASFINNNNVEVAVLPPSFQHSIKDVFGTLKTIVSAGEPLNEVIGKHIQSKGIRLINAYGPTENTVCTTLTDNPFKEDTISIGKPISNVQVYILDKYNAVSPMGVPGQICIAGAQVARGYLNREELTSEKFIKNPYSKEENSKIYKSGDIGRWLKDGSIEYLGRIDDQVKLRGYRIELGEIENVILQSGLVEQAVVLARENNKGDKILIGYVISGNKDFKKEEIISYLHFRLPEYMVPALWVKMENFPSTPSGKIDRKALPGSDAADLLGSNYVAPRNEVEEKLVLLWQDLLGIGKIGVYDNFFELGGHSLLAMRLLTAINTEFQGEVLLIKDIFRYPTINELSKYLEIQLKVYPLEQDSTEYELIDL